MAQTVIGFFEDNLSAYKAVDGLTTRGISSSRIDITKEEVTDNTEVAHKREGENGFTRFFKNLFGDGDEADRYAKVSQKGYTMVTVHARSADEAGFAANLLDDFGAIDVDAQQMQMRNNELSDGRNRDGHDEATRQRIEGDLHFGERNEDRAGKRLRSRIVEKPVEENKRLHEERISIERNPVDRAASERELESFQDGNIDLTERKEIPIVHKEARVVEEIRLHKEVEERDETVHEKVRHNEVDIEKIQQKRNEYANRTDDIRLNEARKNNLRDDADEYDQDKNRKERRDGDPLFGA